MACALEYSQCSVEKRIPWSHDFFLHMSVKVQIIKNDFVSAIVSMSKVATLLYYLCTSKRGLFNYKITYRTGSTSRPLISLMKEKGVGGLSPSCFQRGSKFIVDLSIRGGVPMSKCT